LRLGSEDGTGFRKSDSTPEEGQLKENHAEDLGLAGRGWQRGYREPASHE
jgi:hypothetical protein